MAKKSKKKQKQEDLRIHVQSDGTVMNTLVTDQDGRRIANIKHLDICIDSQNPVVLMTLELVPGMISIDAGAICLVPADHNMEERDDNPLRSILGDYPLD